MSKAFDQPVKSDHVVGHGCFSARSFFEKIGKPGAIAIEPCDCSFVVEGLFGCGESKELAATADRGEKRVRSRC